MHKSEVAALNKDFDYVLAALAALEKRVKELEEQVRVLSK